MKDHAPSMKSTCNSNQSKTMIYKSPVDNVERLIIHLHVKSPCGVLPFYVTEIIRLATKTALCNRGKRIVRSHIGEPIS